MGDCLLHLGGVGDGRELRVAGASDGRSNAIALAI